VADGAGAVEALVKAFAGHPVFVTGHTGFKGSWLSLWLARLGARVHGYALPPPTTPALFELAGVQALLASHTLGDIAALVPDGVPTGLTLALQAAQPQVLFHLAAQPLVRASYRAPLVTWQTNVLGTVAVLEAARRCPSLRAIVVVTSDKCYENREWDWGYREIDPLGGFDPYSASKAATELAVQSARRSFFADGNALIASARAGNVIGGGDFAADRLLPDAYRAVAAGDVLRIRSPHATRPWQHVLDCLHGYLLLAARLLDGDELCATAFNFGPAASDNRPVGELLSALQTYWPELRWQSEASRDAAHEAGFLYLDASRAQRQLGWQPRWPLAKALERTARWYRSLLVDAQCAARACAADLDAFCAGEH